MELKFALLCGWQAGRQQADNIEEKFGKMVKAVTSGKGEILHRTLPKCHFGFPILASKFCISSVEYV